MADPNDPLELLKASLIRVWNAHGTLAESLNQLANTVQELGSDVGKLKAPTAPAPPMNFKDLEKAESDAQAAVRKAQPPPPN